MTICYFCLLGWCNLVTYLRITIPFIANKIFSSMNTKTKYLIPAFAAVFALLFVFAAPSARADDQSTANPDETHHWDSMGHKGPMGSHFVTADGFTGSIQLPDTFDKATQNTLKDQVSVSLFQAASTAQENGLTNANSAQLGCVQNDQGNKYLAWIISDTEEDSGIITVNTLVVDAGNSSNFVTLSNTFDPATMTGHVHGDGTQKFEGFHQNSTESDNNA